MAVRWGLPIDEIYVDEIDLQFAENPHEPMNEESGEEVRNRVIQHYFAH